MEFFYFAAATPAQPPKPLDNGSYFDLTTADVAGDLRKRTIQHARGDGHPGRVLVPRGRPSQHEIDLRYTDALTMADNVMTLPPDRARGRPRARACTPRSCPSRSSGVQGSGMHTHLSLFEGDDNAFYDPDDPYGLSKVARAFIAGLLHHAAEITAVTNQLVNSYKRLVAGFEAPVHVSWARNNRSALIRVPITKKGKDAIGTRIEYRLARPGLQPVPRLLGDPRGRPQGHRGGLRAAARGATPTCSS